MSHNKKKVPETNTKRKTKKKTDDDDSDDNIIEEIDSMKKKVNKKSIARPKGKKDKKIERQEQEQEEEDALSELDINDDDNEPVESAENDEVVINNRLSRSLDRMPNKIIDSKIPIGSLKTDDILNYLMQTSKDSPNPQLVLNYLIQIGKDTLNPQLRYGAINLLRQLTGRRRRYPQNGSKRNENYNNNNSLNRSNSRGRSRGPPSKNSQRSSLNNTHDDLYHDDD